MNRSAEVMNHTASNLAALREFLDQLLDHQDLSESQARTLFAELTAADTPPAIAGAILAALRSKGVRADELRGFAGSMRALARRPDLPQHAGALTGAVDIVGTGGDKSSSLNLSTGASLLTAACGVPVIKHGNRSISSRAGSADVLQALGLPLPLNEAAAGRCFEALGFTFLFAPYYHVATKNIAAVRSALGVRTVFNILGPLSNPAAPPFLVVGAFDLPTAELMAQALRGSGVQRAFVIHGAEGWDEPTPVGPFTLFDVRGAEVERQQRSAADYGLAQCRAEDLLGADAVHNASALRGVFAGEDRGAHRDAIMLGTALALQVTGCESDPHRAVARAAAAIDSGAAQNLLQRLLRFGSSEAE